MVKVLETLDHKDSGKTKVLSQYKKSDNFLKLAEIFLEEMNNLEDVYGSWFEKLDLDTATGINLDYWAELLDSNNRPFGDAPRPENDEVFRSLIYAIIGAYNSDGTARAIQSTLQQVLKADRIFIDDNLDASFSFEVDNPTFIFSKEIVANIVRIAKPVGVEFLGYTISNIYDEPTFGFLEDPSAEVLGYAVLASAEVTTETWVNYRCAPPGQIGTAKRIETWVDSVTQEAMFSLYVPQTANDGTLGATFLNDIQTDFNGVINSKIGFDYDYEVLPSFPPESETVDTISSFSFQTSGGLGDTGGNEIPDAIMANTNNDFDDDKSIGFYGDATFINNVVAELRQKWTVGSTLTIYDKDQNRFDFLRTTTLDSLCLKDDNKFANTKNGLINTSLNQPFRFAEPSDVEEGEQYPLYLTAGNFFDLGNGDIYVLAAGLQFTIYTEDPDADTNFINFVTEFTSHVGRSFTIIGKDGKEVKFVNKRFDADPLANVDDANYRLALLNEVGNPLGYKNYVLYTGGNANENFAPQRYIDVFIDGVDESEYWYANDGSTTQDDPINYIGTNYTSLKQTFDQNNALQINVRNEPDYSSSTGFVNNQQGFGIILYDNETDTKTADVYLNGLYLSTQTALLQFANYRKDDEYSFLNQNTLQISDKPQVYNNLVGNKVLIPYLFPDINQYNLSGMSTSRIIKIDGGTFSVQSTLGDLQAYADMLVDRFETNRQKGNNLIIYDKGGNKWEIRVPERFKDEDLIDEFGFVNTVVSARVNDRYEFGPGSDLDKLGGGHDMVRMFCTLDRRSEPNSYFFDIYKNDVLVPILTDTGDPNQPDFYFEPYDPEDKQDFIANNPDGIYGTVKSVKGSWLINNLSTFDIVTSSLISNYVKIDVSLRKNGVDNVALLENGTPTVIAALSNDQLATLNVNAPAIIDPLIKQTEEGDGEIPDEGFATKGGGRFSLLNL